MNEWLKLLCSAFCFLSITLPINVQANLPDWFFDEFEDLADQSTDKSALDSECHLAFVTGEFRLEPVSMEAEKPIDTLLLYISDADGRIVKDAQVITTVVDQQGCQQSSRAEPFKYGYKVDIDHLPAGLYRVEAEMVTSNQLFTDEFVFNKA